ncbi:hypothetical protein KY284_001099 [Solanum tuberosum]|nr:hypothetical protein KY284_001099 [Solanum tuberosum]
MDCTVLETDDLHITCVLQHVECKEKFMTSFIYAKCKDYLRRPLWDRLMHFSSMDIPWCTIGDFNVITSTDEKQGGRPYNMNKSFEFISVIAACGLLDLGYSGQHFTWCNQRSEENRVWKRLDRVMINDKWLQDMPQTTIAHLPSVFSDHCPLFMEMVERTDHPTKYFKFLHCWTDHEEFLSTVKSCWDREMDGNPMWKVHQKMKRLKGSLSSWSKSVYGDIFSKVSNLRRGSSRLKKMLSIVILRKTGLLFIRLTPLTSNT